MAYGRMIIRLMVFMIVGAAIYGFLRLPELITLIRDEKSINLLVWPNVIDGQYLQDFEKETGIKVHINYFENYEELIVKMQSGIADYDLVMASDYSVPFLIKSGVVKKLDKDRLPFFTHLSPLLMGLSFDQNNDYSIPYSWEMYGIGIDTNFYKKEVPKPSWDILFDPDQAPQSIGMLDDAREVVSIAALYLFGKNDCVLNTERMKQIGQLLQNQKKRVAMYTDLRTDYLLISGSAPAVLGISSDIYRAMREYDSVKFYVPKEGSFFIVDTWLIPSSTQKDNYAYQLLSFLYRPDIVKKYAHRYHFFPALEGIVTRQSHFLLSPSKSLFSRLRLFDCVIPEQDLRELWITLKS